MAESVCPLPVAEPETGLQVLRELARRRSLLAALEVMHAHVGDIFQITLPAFRPAVLVGPETNRSVLVTERDKFLWRSETDPVTNLLRHGILVEDGDSHDRLRSLMDPFLYRRRVNELVEVMVRNTDAIVLGWQDGAIHDMLIEMRRAALLILMSAVFKVDVTDDLDRLWKPILKAIAYISPGFWIVWPKIPRFGFDGPLQQLDSYLYEVIRGRRADPGDETDLLSHLVNSGLSDDLIRDQILTLLIAGHDTSTATLAWALYLLGRHPQAMAAAKDEVDQVLGQDRPALEQIGQLHYLEQVVKETLRLYPPIHVGNRIAGEDVVVDGYLIPAGTRVMYSIYLSHRHQAYWPEPDEFRPERFDRSGRAEQPPFTYVPFGGGPRNCIGAAFALVESKVVLARILQHFDLQLVDQNVKPYMGATLEPHPGVLMRVSRRSRHG